MELSSSTFTDSQQDSTDVNQVGAAILDKHLNATGTAKRGRGRPSNAEKASRLNSPTGNNSAGIQSAPNVPAVSIDPEMVSKSFQNVFRSIDLWVCKRDERRIVALTGDERLAKSVSDEVRANDMEVKGLGDNFAMCCQTYGWLGRHAPATFFGIGLLAYGARVFVAETTIAEIINSIKKTRANANKPSSVQTDNNGQVRDGENVTRN